MAETVELLFEHSPAVGLNLALLPQCVTARRPQIEGREKDDRHQNKKKDDPETAPQTNKIALRGG